MSYTVNGKIYTDHPLMDEIVYNCKIILNEIVIKNDELANSYESEEDMADVELFMMINDGTISFNTFTFTFDLLVEYGYTGLEARKYSKDKYEIPEADREDLLEFACNYFLEHYEEKNQYYRMLMGLPPYNTTRYDVYLDESYFPKDYNKEIDFSKPLHLFDAEDIAILQSLGTMDQIIEEYHGSSYGYLRFLGQRSLDNYANRKAGKYDILYIPTVESLVQDRFIELYTTNRDIYLKRTYSLAYSYSSDYYEQIMIIMILCQTFNDMIDEVPEWYIRRDIFDIRSVQYFLEAYGVEFYKEIPLKYQIRIVKNLNKLIKYKSSDQNFLDILEIFSLKNTAIYRYYIFKKRNTSSSTGYYIDSTVNSANYSLEFVRSQITHSYDDYIKNQVNRTPYDDITYEDKYWDGEDTHDLVKSEHLDLDFTIEGTKYYSIEYNVSLSEYMFQLQYFVGLLLDTDVDMDDIEIAVPSIDSSIKFKLSDLFLLLVLMSISYQELSTEIRYPENNRTESKPEYVKYPNDFNGGYPDSKDAEGIEYYDIQQLDAVYPDSEYDYKYSPNGGTPNDKISCLEANGGQYAEYTEYRYGKEHYYDWMKKQFPEIFVNEYYKLNRFNMKADLNQIAEVIGRRHSKFAFEHGFTLSDLGVEDFMQKDKISTIDELIELYQTDKDIYDNLKYKMIHETGNRDEYLIYKYVFDQLFTKSYDPSKYTDSNGALYSDLVDVLKDRDYILYNTYQKMMEETNVEARQDMMRSIENDIVNTLEYYLSESGLDYIFGFTDVASFDSLIHYIYLLITFFKSFKVYFLDPYVTYEVDDDSGTLSGSNAGNGSNGGDFMAELKCDYYDWDKAFTRDSSINSIEFDFEDHYREDINKEIVDIYHHHEGRYDEDYDGKFADEDDIDFDMDGGLAEYDSTVPYYMINGGASGDPDINLWDLNGASAMEQLVVVDLDGGYPDNNFVPSWQPASYYEKNFNYEVDGGSAGTNQFLTRTVFTRVIDRQIGQEVRFSDEQYNDIIEKDDGLYLKQTWVSLESMDQYKSELADSVDFYDILLDRMTYKVEDITDIMVRESVQNVIDPILSGYRKVVSYVDSDPESTYKAYVDLKVSELYDEFASFNPLGWDEF